MDIFGRLPKEKRAELRKGMQRPEGTLFFQFTPKSDIGDGAIPGGIILEQISGKHHFRLLRTDSNKLAFYHSSPGTGTRVAEVDLISFKGIKSVFISMVWSPAETTLFIGEVGGKSATLSAKGKKSATQLRVGDDGKVYFAGSDGVKVIEMRVNRSGQQVVKPTAKESWDNTKQAISIHSKGTSTDGYIFEVVSSNLAICMMVTGFESYCKTRFYELAQEGVTSKVAPQKVNFQDYKKTEKAFEKGYGITFTRLGVSSEKLKLIKKTIKFRHRITHASPLLPMVNEFDVPPEKPIFSNNKFQSDALELFDVFIEALHAQTLRLRPEQVK